MMLTSVKDLVWAIDDRYGIHSRVESEIYFGLIDELEIEVEIALDAVDQLWEMLNEAD